MHIIQGKNREILEVLEVHNEHKIRKIHAFNFYYLQDTKGDFINIQ